MSKHARRRRYRPRARKRRLRAQMPRIVWFDIRHDVVVPANDTLDVVAHPFTCNALFSHASMLDIADVLVVEQILAAQFALLMGPVPSMMFRRRVPVDVVLPAGSNAIVRLRNQTGTACRAIVSLSFRVTHSAFKKHIAKKVRDA